MSGEKPRLQTPAVFLAALSLLGGAALAQVGPSSENVRPARKAPKKHPKAPAHPHRSRNAEQATVRVRTVRVARGGGAAALTPRRRSPGRSRPVAARTDAIPGTPETVVVVPGSGATPSPVSAK